MEVILILLHIILMLLVFDTFIYTADSICLTILLLSFDVCDTLFDVFVLLTLVDKVPIQCIIVQEIVNNNQW